MLTKEIIKAIHYLGIENQEDLFLMISTGRTKLIDELTEQELEVLIKDLKSRCHYKAKGKREKRSPFNITDQVANAWRLSTNTYYKKVAKAFPRGTKVKIALMNKRA